MRRAGRTTGRFARSRAPRALARLLSAELADDPIAIARPLPALWARTVSPTPEGARAVRTAAFRFARFASETGARIVLTEVDLGPVIEALCAHARAGYREPYKREIIGILLGQRRRNGAFACTEAHPYRALLRARTRCDPNPDALRRRGRTLAEERRLAFLGCYHSHPEEAGSRAWALSPEDRHVFYAERACALEVVVSVAASGSGCGARKPAPQLNRDGSISIWTARHHFRLSAEAKPI